MKYISEYSRRALVNKLAEKISQKLNENQKYTTAIEVIDCINFLVVKGFTSNPKIINLTEFKENFIKEEESFLEGLGIKLLNFIDIIDYKNTIEPSSTNWFEFWNSKRPLYHPSIIESIDNNLIDINDLESVDYSNKIECEVLFPYLSEVNNYWKFSNMSISSHFPFGYSLDLGKSILYYSEYVSYQLFSVLNTDKIIFKYSKNRDSFGDLDIVVDSNSQYKDEDVKSMVLDIFDFNITKFETDYLINYDFTQEITNPFGEKPWLKKDKVRELIFI